MDIISYFTKPTAESLKFKEKYQGLFNPTGIYSKSDVISYKKQKNVWFKFRQYISRLTEEELKSVYTKVSQLLDLPADDDGKEFFEKIALIDKNTFMLIDYHVLAQIFSELDSTMINRMYKVNIISEDENVQTDFNTIVEKIYDNYIDQDYTVEDLVNFVKVNYEKFNDNGKETLEIFRKLKDTVTFYKNKQHSQFKTLPGDHDIITYKNNHIIFKDKKKGLEIPTMHKINYVYGQMAAFSKVRGTEKIALFGEYFIDLDEENNIISTNKYRIYDFTTKLIGGKRKSKKSKSKKSKSKKSKSRRRQNPRK